jgi:hypothetical protein
MSDSDQTESKLDQILGHLVKQGAALGTIVKRLDTIEAQVKLANQQGQRLSRRQSDLEEHFANQAGDCSGLMTRLADRLNSLESMMTPVPSPFVDDDPDDKNGSNP